MTHFSRYARNPVAPWVLLFILSAMIVPQRGGANTYARLATLRAITEQGTIRIDDYKDWSVDWAISPSDGHYYSNKAPGSALLGLPFFVLTDLPTLQRTPADQHGLHAVPGNFTYLFLLFCVQLLPFSILVMKLAQELLDRGSSTEAVHFFALAAFFGSTAAIYMGIYSGHGLAAWLFLAGYFCWRKENFYGAGLFIAAAALTDYATLMTLPFVLIATLWRRPSLKPLGQAVLGSLPIAALWIWYHQTAFGSPFAMASGFANPENLRFDPANAQSGLHGIVSRVPYADFLFQLLFGSQRGILFTQFWVLILGALLPWLKHWWRDGLLLFGGLAGLLWLNASVGSWAAGRSAGPRYICLIFPTLAYFAALVWSDLPKVGRRLLWLGLAQALVYRIYIYPFGERAAEQNLWVFYGERYQQAFQNGEARWVMIKLAVLGATLVLSFVYFKFLRLNRPAARTVA